MTRSPAATGYSATVKLELIADGRTLELAQIGPGKICLRQPCSLPAGDALVVMTVDGRERRWTVSLPDGATPESPWTHAIDVTSVETAVHD